VVEARGREGVGMRVGGGVCVRVRVVRVRVRVVGSDSGGGRCVAARR
jgi:hypothetical protein